MQLDQSHITEEPEPHTNDSHQPFAGKLSSPIEATNCELQLQNVVAARCTFETAKYTLIFVAAPTKICGDNFCNRENERDLCSNKFNFAVRKLLPGRFRRAAKFSVANLQPQKGTETVPQYLTFVSLSWVDWA